MWESVVISFSCICSSYTPGPDTMLIQHRDPDYPLRVREYLRVGARHSPWLANKLRGPHWGDVDVSLTIFSFCHVFNTVCLTSIQIGYGFSPNVAVRERRRFNDVQKEIEVSERLIAIHAILFSRMARLMIFFH